MKINIFFITLFFIISIPGLYYNYIATTSYAMGALISSLSICFIYLLKYKKIVIEKNYFSIFNILILILIISLYSMILSDWFEYMRFLQSYFLIMIYIIASILFVTLSKKTDDKKVYNIINIIFFILVIDGLYMLFKVIFFTSKSKATIFFPEISHFSLIFLSFLLFKLLTSKKDLQSFLWIFISLIFALTIENLTLLVGTILAMIIYSTKKTLLLFIIPVILVTYFLGTDFLIYFIDRMNFFEPKNLSTLVFLSGWERAYLNLLESNFFGIGFNQLGMNGLIGFYQSQIEIIYGLPKLNLLDGGSLAPKIISELGIFGIVFNLIYLFFFFKIIFKIKTYNLRANYLDIFYISSFLMASLSLYVRGSGYFSPAFFLCISSFIYIYLSRYKSKDSNIFN